MRNSFVLFQTDDMENGIDEQLIYKFYQNKCTVEEHKQVLTWLEQSPNKNISSFLEQHIQVIQESTLEHLPETNYTSSDLINALEAKETTQHKWTLLRRTLQVAASLLLLSLGYYSYTNLGHQRQAEQSVELAIQKKQTRNGEQARLKLSDGTRVNLNAGSKLEFPENFNSGRREISLKGQGFFNVTRDTVRPFVVNTQRFRVTVLGTSFDVKSYDEDQTEQVTVKTGKVQVWVKESKKAYILLPGEQLVYNAIRKQCVKKTVKAEEANAWTQGILQFNKTPISDVFDELERLYDVEIVVPKNMDKTCLVSGKHQNSGLMEILRALQFSHGLQYKTKGQKIFITQIAYN